MIKWPTHIVNLVMVFRPLIAHDLPTLTLVSEITALRRKVTLRIVFHWKIEELIHWREHVVGISQQSPSSSASPHSELHKPKRLAGFVEPVLLLIIILNKHSRGGGQEPSCWNIVRKGRNIERGSNVPWGAGGRTRAGRYLACVIIFTRDTLPRFLNIPNVYRQIADKNLFSLHK